MICLSLYSWGWGAGAYSSFVGVCYTSGPLPASAHVIDSIVTVGYQPLARTRLARLADWSSAARRHDSILSTSHQYPHKVWPKRCSQGCLNADCVNVELIPGTKYNIKWRLSNVNLVVSYFDTVMAILVPKLLVVSGSLGRLHDVAT